MSHDLEMARSTHEGEFNLAIGEPYFLQDAYKGLELNPIEKPLRYPTLGGEPELVEVLRKGNDNRFVVVTNGAKQGLQAAFHAIAEDEDRRDVYHASPYWPSYPTLARNEGLEFNGFPDENQEPITVVSSPNNPDGHMPTAPKCDIWDAAYADWVYGFDLNRTPNARISVFSAAKLLGLSGCRVGWVVTEDETLARRMAHHVEVTTSGVSVLSQLHVLSFMMAIKAENKNDPRRRLARETLLTNGGLFWQFLRDKVEFVQGVPDSGQGMFAWFRASNSSLFGLALEASGVKLVSGRACGRKATGWYRMSMGHRNNTTYQALSALSAAYEGLL